MKKFFENLDRKVVGIFFASGKISAVYLKRDNDLWKISESIEVARIEDLELKDLPICICLDSSAVESFRANIPEMPEEDLRGVIDNEIFLRFKSRENFCSAYRKLSKGIEVFLVSKKFLREFSSLNLLRVTIFDPEIKFPIDRGESNERAFFGACSLAFPEFETLNLLPKSTAKSRLRWNFYRLTLALWILSLMVMVGIFLSDRSSLEKSRSNLSMLETRLESLATEDPIEKQIVDRENLAKKLLEENSDTIGQRFLYRLAEISIDSVYVESFSRLENRIEIKIVGADVESLARFVSESKPIDGIFHENLALDKDGSWILDLQIETPNSNRKGNLNVESEFES